MIYSSLDEWRHKLALTEKDYKIFSDIVRVVLLFNKVNRYFMDPGKTELWFVTPNPQLGEISPFEMLKFHRIEKLEKFVNSCIDY